jgi:carboxypeptidase D
MLTYLLEYVVESLPSIDYDIGEMYAGQIPIGNDTTRNMYYVFEPTTGEPVDEVTIWFNGGKGSLSLPASSPTKILQ